jgi:hypothetical protein
MDFLRTYSINNLNDTTHIEQQLDSSNIEQNATERARPLRCAASAHGKTLPLSKVTLPQRSG